MKPSSIAIFLMLMIFFPTSGFGLLCYKCKLTFGYPFPDCRYPNNRTTAVEICSNSTQVCSVQRNINAVGHMLSETIIRECSFPNPPGCSGKHPFQVCTSQCSSDRCNVDNKSSFRCSSTNSELVYLTFAIIYFAF